MTGRLRVLTWPVHGSYMAYLAHVPVDWYVPTLPGNPPGYGGRAPYWPANVREVPASRLHRLELDVVLFQTRTAWIEEQWRFLSDEQRRLPRIYLEHDPPREHPTDTRHFVDNRDVLLVHVTHFNDLMWDSGRTPTRVIAHGVTIPPAVRYSGELERGITVINNIVPRGRRLGADVFAHVRDDHGVPLDLIGMGSDELGGLGEIPLPELPRFIGRYRFFFNPIRYTSLGLAVCEAMMVGLPIVGLATTEMVRTVENGVSGYVDTDVDALVGRMQELLADREHAATLGHGARDAGRRLFSIERFAGEWLATLEEVAGRRGEAWTVPSAAADVADLGGAA